MASRPAPIALLGAGASTGTSTGASASAGSASKAADKMSIKGLSNAVFYGVFKVVVMLISFAVAWMITNNMAQLYTERVFIDDKNPPHLRNMVLMWALFGAIGAMFVIFLAYTLDFGVSKDTLVASALDAAIAFGVGAIVLYGVASVMYNKKYFYYKEDGLRGIRALRDIINWVATALLLLPAGLVLAEYFAKASSAAGPRTGLLR